MVNPDQAQALAATAFVVIVVPGPGVLFIVSRGVSLGRRAGLATVVGHFCALMVQVLAVAAGLGTLFEQSIVAFTVVKLVGAGYLIWLGAQAFRHRRSLATLLDSAHTSLPLRRMVRDGFMVGVANPKGFALFASLLPQFVDASLGHIPPQIVVLGLLCGAIALLSDSAWALAAGTARTWLAASPRRLAAVGGTGGLVTIGLGLRLALSGRRD